MHNLTVTFPLGCFIGISGVSGSGKSSLINETLAPALVREKEKGKIRHIGITENPIVDFTNAMLKRAVKDDVWTVYMVGFHMMHQGARQNVFPITLQKGIGTLLMFAVRSIFADPPRVAREMKALADKGLVEKWLGETDDQIGRAHV